MRSLQGQELLYADNGIVRIGVDKAMGASITHLSWQGYQKNTVNIHDPGRLIQQSYYAGNKLDRQIEGQNRAWSPWPWNPVQGGGVGSWARVTVFEKDGSGTLIAETVPKLWDMPDEEAEALMRQQTGFEPGIPNAIRVECEVECSRDENDAWGVTLRRHQEVPALYFTRNFSCFRVYLGEGKWKELSQSPGPPWGRAETTLNVMACFNGEGQGIAVFSPGANEKWNFGPHGAGNTSEATGRPCVHLAPIVLTDLAPKSTFRYRYWMVLGTAEEMMPALEKLLGKYSAETVQLLNPQLENRSASPN
ncbi:MAG: hypothetical protein AAF357_09700 [Verrucomicrobiota bacterium]